VGILGEGTLGVDVGIEAEGDEGDAADFDVGVVAGGDDIISEGELVSAEVGVANIGEPSGDGARGEYEGDKAGVTPVLVVKLVG
jgi:hypothetical protein